MIFDGTFLTFVSRNQKKPHESSQLQDRLTSGTNSNSHKYEAVLHYFNVAIIFDFLCALGLYYQFSISVTGSPYVWRVILIPPE
jgi:hypothetical protein